MKNLFTFLFTKTSEASTAQVLADLKAIQQRNEVRMAKIKADMGERYILHPSHNKTRLNTPRPV